MIIPDQSHWRIARRSLAIIRGRVFDENSIRCVRDAHSPPSYPSFRLVARWPSRTTLRHSSNYGEFALGRALEGLQLTLVVD